MNIIEAYNKFLIMRIYRPIKKKTIMVRSTPLRALTTREEIIDGQFN